MKYRSDHCKIGLNLFQDQSERGTSLWKLNSSLLNDPILISKIKDKILLMIEVHTCTPHDPNFIKNYKNELPELMITIEQFWEVLLTKLRGTLISYAANNKRKRIQRENKLVKEIEDLDHLFLLNMTDEILEQEITEKNKELEKLRDIKLKGAFIRLRMFSQEEKPNKIFLNLENSNYISKNIKEFKKENNKKIHDPKEILEEMRVFYQDLYSFKEITRIEESMFNNYQRNMPKLFNEESSKLDLKITLNELYTQIFSTKNNKSPGTDGFTNEFLKIFWDELKYLLLELMNFFFETEHINQNFLLGIRTCIPKGNKAKNNITNWRPITLLNSLYKFFSGIKE